MTAKAKKTSGSRKDEKSCGNFYTVQIFQQMSFEVKNFSIFRRKNEFLNDVWKNKEFFVERLKQFILENGRSYILRYANFSHF